MNEQMIYLCRWNCIDFVIRPHKLLYEEYYENLIINLLTLIVLYSEYCAIDVSKSCVELNDTETCVARSSSLQLSKKKEIISQKVTIRCKEYGVRILKTNGEENRNILRSMIAFFLAICYHWLTLISMIWINLFLRRRNSTENKILWTNWKWRFWKLKDVQVILCIENMKKKKNLSRVSGRRHNEK